MSEKAIIEQKPEAEKPAKAEKPEAKKPASEKKPAKPAPEAELEIHVNKTGRVCFGRNAAARLASAGFAIDTVYHMTMAIDKGGLIRLSPTFTASDDTKEVRAGGGRPYISATREFKPLGFTGDKALDIENVKAYGKAGFELRLPVKAGKKAA